MIYMWFPDFYRKWEYCRSFADTFQENLSDPDKPIIPNCTSKDNICRLNQFLTILSVESYIFQKSELGHSKKNSN